MKVSEIMTPKVICTTADADVRDLAKTMVRHGISGVPVVDSAYRLAGIVTEGDLLRRAEYGAERHRTGIGAFLAGPGKLAAEFIHSHGRRVGDVMTADVITVTEDSTVEDVVNLMEKYRIKRVPVVSGGRVVGIVSRSNLLRLLGETVKMPAFRSDEALRAEVGNELRRHPWSRQVSRITVRNGIVDVHGVIYHDAERRAITVAVENLPGVRAVRTHLVWIEPLTGAVVEESPSAA